MTIKIDSLPEIGAFTLQALYDEMFPNDGVKLSVRVREGESTTHTITPTFYYLIGTLQFIGPVPLSTREDDSFDESEVREYLTKLHDSFKTKNWESQ